jgi:hypothetical protein
MSVWRSLDSQCVSSKPQKKEWIVALLICFPESLIVLFGLLLEELNPSLEGLVLGVVLETLAGGLLGFLQGGLGLLNLILEQLVAVVEGCDLLFLGEVLLLQCLDTGLKLVDLLVSFVGLSTECDHALFPRKLVSCMGVIEDRRLCMYRYAS